MKKSIILISVLMALPFVCASAQDDGPFEIVSSPSDKSSLEVLSHIGYGYNVASSKDFEIKNSEEFFVNILNIKAFPVPVFCIELGVDYKTSSFNSTEDAFYLDNSKEVHTQPFGQKYPGSFSKNFSRLRTNTFSAPLQFKICAGDFSIGVGAEANLNLPGRVKDKFFVDGRKNKFVDKGARFNRFNYNFLATVSFYDTGLYVRYYPKNSHLMPEGGLDLSYWTIGVIYNM